MTQKLDFAAMPHEQRLQWLAEQTNAKGAPLLPGLRYPCQVGRGVHFGEDDTSHLGKTCPGWQVSLDAEHLLLSELVKVGYRLLQGINSANHYVTITHGEVVAHASNRDDKTTNWESALSLAACRAVEKVADG